MSDNDVPESVVNFMDTVVEAIINPLIGLIFALALVYFLWGLAVFIVHASADDKRSEGKRHMLHGVIGMTVMVSVYAIIQMALATFGVDTLAF